MRSTLTAAILFAAVLGVNAQTMNLKADIPFDFVVGSKTMPAGVYDVKHAAGVLTLHKQGETPTSVMALAQPAQRPAAEQPATLIFNRYGNDYFLSRVWPAYGDTGPSLPRGRRENEVIASSRSEEVNYAHIQKPTSRSGGTGIPSWRRGLPCRG